MWMKKILVKPIVVLLIVALALTGCSSDQDPEQEELFQDYVVDTYQTQPMLYWYVYSGIVTVINEKWEIVTTEIADSCAYIEVADDSGSNPEYWGLEILRLGPDGRYDMVKVLDITGKEIEELSQFAYLASCNTAKDCFAVKLKDEERYGLYNLREQAFQIEPDYTFLAIADANTILAGTGTATMSGSCANYFLDFEGAIQKRLPFSYYIGGAQAENFGFFGDVLFVTGERYNKINGEIWDANVYMIDRNGSEFSFGKIYNYIQKKQYVMFIREESETRELEWVTYSTQMEEIDRGTILWSWEFLIYMVENGNRIYETVFIDEYGLGIYDSDYYTIDNRYKYRVFNHSINFYSTADDELVYKSYLFSHMLID